jgi:transposase
MARRLMLQPHLSLNELETRYRQAKDATQRTHYQVIWLLTQGKTTAEVAEVTGYGKSWIYEIVRSYNHLGPEMLGDQRRHNQGNQPLLNEVQQAQLWQALQEAPPDGGLWNGPKVADWMSQLLGRPVAVQRGWEYLQGLRWRLRVPRPQHESTDPEEQEVWKKKLQQEVAAVQTAHPDADVEAWAMDEHRVGLKPLLRKMWVEVPEGIHLVFMPPHSPELQPAERLWPLTNEPIANHSFETLDELVHILFERCRALLKLPELVRGLTNFHWWPQTAA